MRDPVLAHGEDGGDDMAARIVLARTIALPRHVLGGKRYRINRIPGALNKTKDPLVAHSSWNLLKLGITRELNPG
jgi:hypothetical protein